MSGIYIPGMEMPVCHFKTSESYNVHGFWVVYPDGKSKLHIMVGSDHWVCEAIPVPDHGRLIDKDALEQDISDSVVFSGREIISEIYGANKIINRIHHAPTIIPADKEGEG